jgi:nucleotide-binding universal stress UspA family protein
MEMKTLIPVDGTITSDRTLEKISALKERFSKELTLLHVVDIDKLAYRMIPDFQIDMVRENAEKAGQKILDERMAILVKAGFSVTSRLEFGSPRQTICKIANEESFQLTIIGRREITGEIRDVLFGSVTNYVLHNVSCPVLLF